MKKLIFVSVFILLMLISCSPDPRPCDTPKISVSEDGDARWQSVKGAVSYEYIIDDNEPVRVDSNITAIRLLNNESIKVRAIGDGEKYFDSEWSNIATYVSSKKQPLPSPKIITNGNLVTWEAMEGKDVLGYEYILNNAEPVICTDPRGVFLSNTDTLKVKAISANENYLDSEYAVFIMGENE